MRVLGVRKGNLYRLMGQPIRVLTRKNREADEEEKEAPSVVKQVSQPTTQDEREWVAPPMVLAQREPKFIGIQPSGSSKEKKPPMSIQRKLDFRGSKRGY
jgi:hypothetical protein